MKCSLFRDPLSASNITRPIAFRASEWHNTRMADQANKSLDGTADRRRQPRYTPLLIVLVAVSFGIITDRLCPVAIWVWFSASALALAAWLLAQRRGWAKTAGVLVLLAAAFAAAGRHHCRWSLFDENDIGLPAAAELQTAGSAQPVCLRAVVAEGPRLLPAPAYDPMRIMPRIDRTRMELRIIELRDGSLWRPAGGRATLFIDGHVLGIHAGDRVQVMAALCRPGPSRNPGGRDRASYLRADGQLATLRGSRPECVTLLEASTLSTANSCVTGLFRLPDHARAAGQRILWKYLDERSRGLAAALLLGSRDQVGREQYAAFVETGTIHLLAVSGLHVGILAGMLFALTRLLSLSRRHELLLVAVAIVGYAFLTGGRPPVVRATVLVLMFCLSCSLARRPSPYNALAAAGLVVLALNPAELFRLGAQLSFLAVTAIMFFMPRFVRPRRLDDYVDRALNDEAEDMLKRALREAEPPIKKALRKIFHWYWQGAVLSLVIWLVATPLVMARFHIVSPGSILLTPLLVPLVACALFFGLIVLACGWLFPPLAALAAVFCDWSLLAIQGLIDAAHWLPYGHRWVVGPADWWLAGFYGGLAIVIVFPRYRPKWRWCAALLAGWIALGLVVSHWGRQDGCLACTFLAVGHGCATVVELPDGKTILYDVGQFSSPDACAANVANCLWSRGITRLDAVVISHADADHYNGLPRLMEMIPVAAVYVSPGMFDAPNSSLRFLKESIDEAGIPIRHLQAGDRLDAKLLSADCDEAQRYRIDVLHPDAKPDEDGAEQKTRKIHDNSRSIVLLITYRGRRILLPGDLEPPGLDDLLARRPIDCDALLVPHHGSGNSNPPGLAAWCRPEIAVISGGLARNPSKTENAYKNAPGNSHHARVFHTGRVGAVRVEIRNGEIQASGFLEKGPANEPRRVRLDAPRD
jgi:competence protein ComEC